MTDKELRRLKRSELLELMFYLREELDKLKEENDSLKSRLDNLTKSSMESRLNLSDEIITAIRDTVRSAVEETLSESVHKNNPDSSNQLTSETE